MILRYRNPSFLFLSKCESLPALSKISRIFDEKETLWNRHRCCDFSTTECAIFSKKIANFRKRATYENYKGIGFSINAVEYRLSKRIADFFHTVKHSIFFFLFQRIADFQRKKAEYKIHKKNRVSSNIVTYSIFSKRISNFRRIKLKYVTT